MCNKCINLFCHKKGNFQSQCSFQKITSFRQKLSVTFYINENVIFLLNRVLFSAVEAFPKSTVYIPLLQRNPFAKGNIMNL